MKVHTLQFFATLPECKSFLTECFSTVELTLLSGPIGGPVRTHRTVDGLFSNVTGYTRVFMGYRGVLTGDVALTSLADAPGRHGLATLDLPEVLGSQLLLATLAAKGEAGNTEAVKVFRDVSKFIKPQLIAPLWAMNVRTNASSSSMVRATAGAKEWATQTGRVLRQRGVENVVFLTENPGPRSSR